MVPTPAVFISIIVAQIALIAALIGFIIRYGALAISNGLDVPFVPTPPSYYPRIAEALAIRTNDVVYDLGCGNGRMILFLAPRFPRARFVGIERNLILYMQAQVRRRLAGNPNNVEFRRQNFYEADFSDATRIYAYLLTTIMDALFPEGTHRGTRVVSRAFRITNCPSVQTIELSKTPGLHGQHLLRVYEL